jgi:hypothetical protein
VPAAWGTDFFKADKYAAPSLGSSNNIAVDYPLRTPALMLEIFSLLLYGTFERNT